MPTKQGIVNGLRVTLIFDDLRNHESFVQIGKEKNEGNRFMTAKFTGFNHRFFAEQYYNMILKAGEMPNEQVSSQG